MAVLIWLAALIIAAGGGWAFTKAVLALASRTSRQQQAADGPGEEPPLAPTPLSTLRGGTWIGILERVAVAGCILVGYPAGVAVVVAIKGLGRFPELKGNPAASERFIIGSLASLLFASALGVAASALIAHLST